MLDLARGEECSGVIYKLNLLLRLVSFFCLKIDCDPELVRMPEETRYEYSQDALQVYGAVMPRKA